MPFCMMQALRLINPPSCLPMPLPPPSPPSPSPPGIVEQLVDCSGGDEVSEESGFRRKAAALFAVLQEQRAQRAIVFCNKIDTCGWGGACLRVAWERCCWG